MTNRKCRRRHVLSAPEKSVKHETVNAWSRFRACKFECNCLSHWLIGPSHDANKAVLSKAVIRRASLDT